jgi:hypothetical protein
MATVAPSQAAAASDVATQASGQLASVGKHVQSPGSIGISLPSSLGPLPVPVSGQLLGLS